jgi:hypothetical protein
MRYPGSFAAMHGIDCVDVPREVPASVTLAALVIPLTIEYAQAAGLLASIWNVLMVRGSGPLHFRLILQPIVAAVLALRAGRNDARQGKSAFLRAFVREREKRRVLLLDTWKDTGKLFLVGVALDVIYQLIASYSIRPVESLIVATILAVIPYLIVRGLTNRIMTWWRGGRASS